MHLAIDVEIGRLLPHDRQGIAHLAGVGRAASTSPRRSNIAAVTRIDRLARSMKDLQDIVHELKGRGIALKATEQPIDTGTAAGKAFLNMLGVFAEFETNLRRERQVEGINAAKARGAYKGGKTRIDPEAVRKLISEGMKPAHIARKLGISRGTVYKFIPQPRNMPAT